MQTIKGRTVLIIKAYSKYCSLWTKSWFKPIVNQAGVSSHNWNSFQTISLTNVLWKNPTSSGFQYALGCFWLVGLLFPVLGASFRADLLQLGLLPEFWSLIWSVIVVVLFVVLVSASLPSLSEQNCNSVVCFVLLKLWHMNYCFMPTLFFKVAISLVYDGRHFYRSISAPRNRL